MTMKWEVPDKLLKAISEVHRDLDYHIQDLRNEWDDRSERWQESDRGNEVLGWIDLLEDAAREFESVLIDDLPATPEG